MASTRSQTKVPNAVQIPSFISCLPHNSTTKLPAYQNPRPTSGAWSPYKDTVADSGFGGGGVVNTESPAFLIIFCFEVLILLVFVVSPSLVEGCSHVRGALEKVLAVEAAVLGIAPAYSKGLSIEDKEDKIRLDRSSLVWSRPGNPRDRQIESYTCSRSMSNITDGGSLASKDVIQPSTHLS